MIVMENVIAFVNAKNVIRGITIGRNVMKNCECYVNGECICYAMGDCVCDDNNCDCEDCEEGMAIEIEATCACGGNCGCGAQE